jgi:glycosyltransferase involved in cell wall biosynthesis
MKVLIINYYYPPVVGAHCYRWHQIAQHWNKAGHEVHVVTSKVAGLPSMRDESGITVCRTGLVAQKALVRGSLVMASSGKKSLRTRFLDFLRPLYRKLYWPDAMFHWLPFALWQMWKRRNTSYDVVVSYYPVFASALSAWFYRKVSKDASFAWIADYGDPFSTSESMPPNNYALYRRLNIFTERFVAREIDVIVLTSAETMAGYLSAGIARADKLEVIPSLVDVDLFYAKEKVAVGADFSAEIHLVYIGALHRNIREPGILYELVAALNDSQAGPRIVLDMYGPNNGVETAPEGNSWVRYHGPVVREDAIALMRGAHVLVDIGNDNCSMIPSKITEYVATGKAILAMRGNGRSHPAMTRYGDYGRVLAVDKHRWEAADLEAVRHFIVETAGTCVERALVDDVLDSFVLTGVALRYENVAGRIRAKTS